MRLLPACLLGLLAAFAAGSPRAAETAAAAAREPGRPRVGLVLSGGGARGAAHVGVLKMLDELRIPVDAIAGTSMGAVVGGLYAAGLSGREIEQQMTSVDWEDAFRDRTRRLDSAFRRKREDLDYLVNLPLGLRGGRFLLPRGLIQGQKLSLLLRELTLRVSDVGHFDRLPVPFRAVATDLESGEPVVLDRGDLATAIRASLSAPGIFAPVEHEGRLLVDGGIANNLPVDVVRAMGVDVLIVVDVGFPLGGRERLQSVGGISNQMLAILIRRNTQRQLQSLRPEDIRVDPELGDASSFDFGRLPRAIAAGEVAARAAALQLAALSLPPAEHERYLAARQRARTEGRRLDFVRVDAGSARYAAVVDAAFGDLVGTEAEPGQVALRVNRLYGRGTFEALEYRLVRDDAENVAGPEGLLLQARRNSWGPNYVRFGLRLQDDFAGNSSFDAASRFILTELSDYGAEWTWDVQVGANPRVATQAYLPFSHRQRWFVAPRAAFQVRNVPQVEDERQVGSLRVRSTRVGIDLGREIQSYAELRAGIEREYGSQRVRLGDTTTPKSEFRTREYFGRFTWDTLDRVGFPRRGSLFSIEYRGTLEDQLSDRISDSVTVDWRLVRSWGRNTAVVWASGGTLLAPEYAGQRTWYPLGGFLNLSGLTPDALRGPHFGIARAIFYRQVGRGGEGFLNVPLYLGLSAEAGNVWQDRGDMGFGGARRNASLFFGADTFLGPAYLAAGYDDRGGSAFYLFLGRGF